jgi:hypothetical protein
LEIVVGFSFGLTVAMLSFVAMAKCVLCQPDSDSNQALRLN